ncbi:MAG: response regulator transcription factor [Bacteroidetes bacterium]|nr:response regulator transcription factor [Bacteroidota bacterium]
MNTQQLQCYVVDDDATSRMLVQKFIEQTDFLSLAGSFEDGEQAVSAMTQHEPDLLFLDVEMPRYSGLDILRNLENPPCVILITSNKEYALDAFDYDVMDFLLKPLSYPRFLKAVTKVKEELAEPVRSASRSPGFLFIKNNSRYLKLETRNIRWIEAIGDYVEIHVAERKYVVHSTMKVMDSKLGNAEFLRVHRSYIVRIDQIDEIEDNTLILGDKFIPVGKSYRKQLMTTLNMI